MEERIEVQKGNEGEILFRKFEEHTNYTPEREERLNSQSLETAFEDILVHFSAINDLMNKLPEDNAGICMIFDAIYRDTYQQMWAIADLIKASIGEIELKYSRCSFTNGLPVEPEALTFKPSELLLQNLNPAAEAKDQKHKAVSGAKG